VGVPTSEAASCAAPTQGGARYFLTCYDDYTRRIWVCLLKKKSEAFQAIKDYIALAENQLDTTVETIRSDQSGEFIYVHGNVGLDAGEGDSTYPYAYRRT
jgi:hypothetical protein